MAFVIAVQNSADAARNIRWREASEGREHKVLHAMRNGEAFSKDHGPRDGQIAMREQRLSQVDRVTDKVS